MVKKLKIHRGRRELFEKVLGMKYRRFPIKRHSPK